MKGRKMRGMLQERTIERVYDCSLLTGMKGDECRRDGEKRDEREAV